MPKVGIVLSTYNRLDMLKRMVDSVFAQDWRDWLLYLCDDASGDGTAEWCTRLCELHPGRVRHLRQPRNWGNVTRGRNDAILRGLDEDGADYFVFSDDDNTWKPNRLSAHLAFMEANPDCGMSWCHCEGFKDGGSIGRIRPGEPDRYDRNYLLTRPYIDSNEIMARKEVFEEIGLFDERLKTLEDWDFTLRVGMRFPVLHLDADLVNYNLHAGNRVQQTMHLNQESCERIAIRERLAGPRYHVLFVRPPAREGVINHSHRQVMGYIEAALERIPWVAGKAANAAEPLLAMADEFRPNLIVYFYPARQTESTVSFLRQRPYPSLGLCVEDPYAHEMNKQARPFFEWFVTNDAGCLEAYKSPGNPYALLMPTLAADNEVHQPRPDLKKRCDVVMVGAPYPKRIEAAKRLIPLVCEGKRIVVIGEGWGGRPLQGIEVIDRNIPGKEMAAWLSSAKVTLVVNRDGVGQRPVTPARGFAEAACGACMLLEEDREGLGRYFRAGEEYLGWKDLSEIEPKARALLADGALRRKLSENARARARKYTWEARLGRLFMLVRSYRADDEVM